MSFVYLLFFSYLAYFAYSNELLCFLEVLGELRILYMLDVFCLLEIFFTYLRCFAYVLESLCLFLVLQYTITYYVVYYSYRKSTYCGIGFPGILQVLQIFFASVRSDKQHFPMTSAKYIFCPHCAFREFKADLCWGLWSLQLYRFCSRSCRGLRKEVLL